MARSSADDVAGGVRRTGTVALNGHEKGEKRADFAVSRFATITYGVLPLMDMMSNERIVFRRFHAIMSRIRAKMMEPG
ncbi:MAG TPA: hypothetical protein VM223_04000 [Planctomycetota bacterium]|nr:hypothetical protein [Planctomycetota bacterium]